MHTFPFLRVCVHMGDLLPSLLHNRVFFVEGGAPYSKDDHILFTNLKTLSWVLPKHLTVQRNPSHAWHIRPSLYLCKW